MVFSKYMKFFMVMSVALAFCVPALAYDNSLSGSWGTNWGIAGEGIGGEGEVEIFDVSLGGDGEAFLGCSGFSFDGMIDGAISSINMEDAGTMVKDYISANIGQYLLTQVYRSPQIGALFDSLEAIGNARASMVQARCDANEAKEAGRQLALQDCMMEANKEKSEKKRAQKIKECNEPKGLAAIMKELEGSPTIRGNTHDYLSGSSLCDGDFFNQCQEDITRYDGDPAFAKEMKKKNRKCKNTSGLPDKMAFCPILAFIPNIKYCVGSSCDSDETGESEPVITGAKMVTTGTQTASTYMLGDIKYYFKGKQQMLEKVEGIEDPVKRVELESKFEEIIKDSRFKTPEPTHTTEGLPGPLAEFTSSLGCTDISPYAPSARAYREGIEKYYSGTLEKGTGLDLGESEEDKAVDKASWEVVGGAADIRLRPETMMGEEVDIPSAESLLKLAVRCVRNHDYSLTMYDIHTMMKTMTLEEVAMVQRGVAAKVSYLASDHVLYFTEQQILDKIAERYGSSSVAEGSRTKPEDGEKENIENSNELDERMEKRLKFLANNVKRQRERLALRFERNADFARAASSIQDRAIRARYIDYDVRK